ncbi:hypothetical protein GLYMA_06G213525v4 [Glycine max]|nr:hypothetical protein GLYMA_06G213525v4 [Glycine max]KAH1126970.1 hypothetical protein GYH30_015803 [Glycine max]
MCEAWMVLLLVSFIMSSLLGITVKTKILLNDDCSKIKLSQVS